MKNTEDAMLKLIHETKAVSIWNHKTGPVFWYAASVPGPFYVNTELVIGPALAKDLLEKITNIVAGTEDNAKRAAQLNEVILGAYRKDAQYQQVIAVMVEKAKREFAPNSYTAISGGERRDWLFSIPFAAATGIKHVFLFKNKTFYCTDALKPNEPTLHIADLINNAASYFDLWFPLLQKAQLNYIGTICVNIRGTNGLNRLSEHGKQTVTLNNVDTTFFEKSFANDLIDQTTLDEIKSYFVSSKEWAEKYLMKNVGLFDVPHLSAKDFERLQSFFANDPWKLKADNAAFFAAMQIEINKRLKG